MAADNQETVVLLPPNDGSKRKPPPENNGYMFEPGTRCLTAVWKVLVRNDNEVSYAQSSLLGTYGHWERSNAWTHLVAAVVIAAYAVAMFCVWWSDGTIRTPAAILSLLASACAVWAFVASAVFHMLRINEWKKRLRWLDHASIYLLLAMTAAANVAITTDNFTQGTPLTTVLDEACAALLLSVYFGVRDACSPVYNTVKWGDCAFGLFREQLSDGVHTGARASCYIALIMSFILHAVAANRHIPSSVAPVVAVFNCVAIVCLIAGKVNDDYFMWPDATLERVHKSTGAAPRDARRRVGEMCTCGVCPLAGEVCISNASCGCVMNHHALWHVSAAVAVFFITAARDIVICTRRT